MHSLLNVLRKEWRDTIRDRRSIVSSLLFAVIAPLVMFLVLGSLAKEADSNDDIQAAVIGVDQAPVLINKLAEQGIQWTQVESGEEAGELGLPVLVTVPDHYAERYLDRVPVTIAVTADFKDSVAEASARRVARLIDAYGQRVSHARLVAAGVSPDSVRAVSASTYDLSQAGSQSSHITNALIYLLLISGFVSGALMATDSIAGERERHTLESLLSQPVNPLTLVAGKWLTTGSVSMFVSVSTMVITGVMLALAPLEILGLRLFVDPASIALGAVVLLPLALLAVSIQMLLAARARTYREAGTYAQFALAIPVVVAGSVMLSNVDYGALGQILPVTSQTMILQDVLLEGGSSLSAIVGGAASTLLLAAGLVWLMSQRLSDERSL